MANSYGTRRRFAARSFALLLAATGAAHAQPAPTPSSSSAIATAPDPKKEEARDLLKKGLALYATGDVEKALDFFLRSRAVFAAKGNTLNAANSLRTLGRLDESLELYEEAVASFGSAFDDDDKVAVPAAMAQLREKLGTVRVSADVAGALVIDGRPRGTLPSSSGVRLMPGEHTLRVMKQGYKTYEARVTVVAGETQTVDAKLEPLAASGGLRIESPTLEGAEVSVDGVIVGVAPWEGTLAPGPHVVVTRRGEQGSAPTRVTVLQGQTALLRVRSGHLSGRHRFIVRPASAELALGDVPLGRAEWQGQLPPGVYEVRAYEDGFLAGKRDVQVTEVDEGGVVEITLDVDRTHPRWPKKPVGRLSAEVISAWGFGTTMNSGANASCSGDACRHRGLVSGPIVGAVASFEFPFRVSLDAAGGALSLSQSLSRDVPRSGAIGTNQGVTYALDDLSRFKGWWLGAGAGFRAPLTGRWSLRARMLVGVVFAKASDTITGVAQAGGTEARATVDGSGSAQSSTPFFALPQVGVTAQFGSWSVGGALSGWIVLSSGGDLGHGAVRVFPNCPASAPSAPGCVADSSQLQHERAYGVFALVAPQVSLARSF